jgi:hypothetical protein
MAAGTVTCALLVMCETVAVIGAPYLQRNAMNLQSIVKKKVRNATRNGASAIVAYS